VEDLKALLAGRRPERVIVDPSAASFIQALRRAGFPVTSADNDVADGIRVTADLLKRRRIILCLDNDEHGRQATQKLREMFSAEDYEVSRFNGQSRDRCRQEQGQGAHRGQNAFHTGFLLQQFFFSKSSEKCSPQRTMRCMATVLHRERIGMSICCNEMCSGKGGDNFQKKKSKQKSHPNFNPKF